MIADTTIWDKEDFARGESSVRKVVCSVLYAKVRRSGISIDPAVRCTALPTRKDVGETHVERARSEDILADATFAISIARECIFGDECVEMGTVNGTLDSSEEWVEPGIVSDLRRSMLVLWELDIPAIQACRHQHVKDAVKNTA